MKCVGIIWNCAFEYKDEILKIMSEHCKIEQSYCINLGNNYEIFLRAIYSFETIAKWKVDIIFHCSETQEEYDADTQIIKLFH